MELPPRWAFLLFLLLSSTKASGSAVDKEEFQEELLLKPLPDRKVLAHFHFETRAPPCNSNGRRHHHLFPKAISQMVIVLFDSLPTIFFFFKKVKEEFET